MGLTARSLSHTYGAGTSFAAQALTDIDLDLERGELVLIAGSTGSGKSTLLRLLSGLLEATSGTVSVDGVPLLAREARGRVAIVFQNPEAQFFAETILADVAFGPRNLGADDPERAARSALEAVGLDVGRFAGRSPFTVSGGEARRVAIAGALAMGAPYLLLDEPTAGLDGAGRKGVRAVIEAERVRAGIAVVTHDPEEFLDLADRIVVLQGGERVFEGAPSSLLDAATAYERTGLMLPDVLRAQLRGRLHGGPHEPPVFEPDEAARALVRWRGAAR